MTDDTGLRRLPEALVALERLLGFDTTSRNSNLPLIDWAEAYLTGLGGAASGFPTTPGKRLRSG